MYSYCLHLILQSCFAGYIFSNDVIDAMEKYSMHLVNSVMERAEATCRDLKATNVDPPYIS